MKAYNLVGGITITVIDVDCNNKKVIIDRGNVDFNVENMPKYWGMDRYGPYGGKYKGATIIHNDEHELTPDDFYYKNMYIKNGGVLSKELADDFVEAFIKVVDKLVEIGYIKEEKAVCTPDIFTGLAQCVESMVYDFDGCIVKVSKTDEVDKFEINITPGPYDFTHMASYNSKCRIEICDGCAAADGRWWIASPQYFKNGDKLTICGINAVLRNVHGGVEFMKARPKFEIELPTTCKVFDLSGIKVTVKPVGDKYKISIDSNGYDLKCSTMPVKTICINGDSRNMDFWVDMTGMYDWYMYSWFIRECMAKDLDKFDHGSFDNGIELSAKGALMFINALNSYFKQCTLVRSI